jgi:hypothetical protein
MYRGHIKVKVNFNSCVFLFRLFMDSVGQLIQSLTMLDSQPSDTREPCDDCSGSHSDNTIADTEGCENFETNTNSCRHVGRSAFSRVSGDTGSGDEPPEDRPVTLKRRYLTTAEECNMLTIILCFISLFL